MNSTPTSESSSCIICLDNSGSYNTYNIYNPYKPTIQPYLQCQCVYNVHSHCFRDWRLYNNICLICRNPLDPLPLIVYASPATWKYDCCSKWFRICVHLYCAYMIWINLKDIIYDSLMNDEYEYEYYLFFFI